MSETLVELHDVGLDVLMDGDPHELLRSVGFAIHPGEVLGLVGESGCGKSMTALAIAALLPPTVVQRTGSIVFSQEMEELRLKKKRRLAMIFQEPMTSLNPLLPVGTQVGEALLLHRSLPRRQREELVYEALAEVGLEDVRRLSRCYPHQLSGGMRQRVMIASAIIDRVPLLIADEPTTALDVMTQAQVLHVFKQINREHRTAILFISHDVSVVRSLCSRILVMYAGSIVEEGFVADVLEHPLHEYTKGLLASIPTAAQKGKPLHSILGRVPAVTEVKAACPFAPRCPLAMRRCYDDIPLLYFVANGHAVACHAVQERGDAL